MAAKRKPKCGIALAVTLMVAAIIVVLGSWMVQAGLSCIWLASNDNASQASLYAAEAGVNEIRVLMQTNIDALVGAGYTTSGWPGWPYASPSPASFTEPTPPSYVGNYIGSATPSVTPTPYYVYNSSGAYAEYSMYVYNNVQNTSTVTAPDGVRVPPLSEYVKVVADCVPDPNNPSSKIAPRKVGMIYSKNGLFYFAAMGVSKFTVSGSGKIQGNVAVSATSSPAIVLSGSGKIMGTALVGAGVSNPTNYISGNKKLYTAAGSMPTQMTPTPFYPTSVPYAPYPGSPSPYAVSSPWYDTTGTNVPTLNPSPTLTPNMYGDLSIPAGSTYVLQPGGIYLFNNISLGNNSVLQVPSSGSSANPVKIYFSGTFSMNGTAVIDNGTGSAAALLIYGTPTATTATVIGNSNSSGANNTEFLLYAPSANITLGGNSQITGAVVGNTVTVSGSGNLKYDPKLMTVEDPSAWFSEAAHWRQ